MDFRRDGRVAGAELREAPADAALFADNISAAPASEKAAPAGEQRRQAIEAAGLAQQALTARQAELASLRATLAAEQAKYSDPPSPEASHLAAAAAEAQRALRVAQAEEELARAEAELAAAKRSLSSKDKKSQASLTEAQKKHTAAMKKRDAALAGAKQTDAKYEALGKTYPRTSTGRRLALARWIADKRNPLTARVAVNHVWMRHFGQPLVPTVFDFGLNGKPPTHPQLLDWLAVEFMEHDWSLKWLHRLMVTSQTYDLASTTRNAPLENMRRDPDNRYLWRMNSRRMEAEIVRDSVLSVAWQLDPTMGGPEIDQNTGQTVHRRSVYFRHAHEKRMEFLRLFDAASVNECYRRNESVVPQQALALANSPLALEQSRLLARRLGEEVGSHNDEDFIVAAFEQVLCRAPTNREREICLEFLSQQSGRLAQQQKLTSFGGGAATRVKPAVEPAAHARENLIHVLLNHNEFVTIR